MSDTAKFDVFLSYHTLDQAAVERIGRALQERGLSVFLDRWELVSGRPWPETLEAHFRRCRAAAVVLGPAGMGSWQQRELSLALDRQARDAPFFFGREAFVERLRAAVAKRPLVAVVGASGSGGSTVGPAHEALMREWPRLAALIAEHRDQIGADSLPGEVNAPRAGRAYVGSAAYALGATR